MASYEFCGAVSDVEVVFASDCRDVDDVARLDAERGDDGSRYVDAP